MFIRNIITTSALVVLLGLTGGSAYAQDVDSHIVEGFTASAGANSSGTEFAYNGDSDVIEGDILTVGFEQARLPQHTVEILEIEYRLVVTG